MIDSLIRPVYAQPLGVAPDGRREFVICEFGDNIGRLSLHRYDGGYAGGDPVRGP